MTKMVKCAHCEERGNKNEMIQERNKRYYHKEDCHKKYLEQIEFAKTERKLYYELIAKIGEIHNIEHTQFIPSTFHTYLYKIRNEKCNVREEFIQFYPDLIKCYEYCREKIINAKNARESKGIDDELKYGLTIAINHMINMKNNIILKEVTNNEIPLTDEQLEFLKTFIIESPIEEKFIKGIIYSNNSNDFKFKTQYDFTVRDRKYRVDIIVQKEYKGKKYMFVIECDGHDFHEKTKEEASRDKQRDRDFLSIGIPTIRYSGRDIFEDTMECVHDMYDVINGYIKVNINK